MKTEELLSTQYDILEKMERLQIEVPTHISKNLNPKFALRPYQERAIARYLDYIATHQQEKNTHLLFELATGAGKTMIMASLILQLYKEGYRTFLFFVNSSNIVEKTKQNFANAGTSKYLFHETIEIDNSRIAIRAIESIEEANSGCINILFTTIQGLHSQIGNPKENALVLSDFAEQEIVLLADEAHHTRTQTKARWSFLILGRKLF